jgi:hemoglobin/transferrin/lactoferrin receptor protein
VTTKKKLLLFLSLSTQLCGDILSSEITKMDPQCYYLIHEDTASETQRRRCLNTSIEEIVVTGTRIKKKPRFHPGSLSVISDHDIQRSMVDGAAELLADVPGVQISDAGQAGSKRLRIRGEESRRIAVLIDNQEVTDHREVGVPLTLDPQMIERVEVVRGASSVLYGSKAIGGVVNFITKKGGYHALQTTTSLSYNDATDGQSEFVSVYGAVNDVDYRFSATSAKNDNRQTSAGEIENTRSNSESVSFYSGFSLSEQQRLELNYVNHKSDAEVFVEQQIRTEFPLIDFSVDVPRRDREKLGLLYQFDDINEYLTKIEFNAYRQISDRQFNTFPTTFTPTPLMSVLVSAAIYTDSTLTTDGALLQSDWRLPADNTLIAGVQYLFDDMEQDRLSITEVTRTIPSHPMSPAPPVQSVNRLQSFSEATMQTLAAFVQDEWSPRENLILTLGARQYWVDAELDDATQTDLPSDSVEDQQLVVAFSALYTGQDNFVWRFNTSQGYVYPSLLQMATGAYGGSSFINPNGNLAPETSDNIELGMRYFQPRWLLDLTAFYSESENYIDHVPCTLSDNCVNFSRSDRIYQNVGESTNRGLELMLEYEIPESAIQPYLSLSWMERENQYDDFSTKKTGWPEWSARVGTRYQQMLGGHLYWLDTFVRNQSGADELTPNGQDRELKENSGWATINLSCGVSIGDKQQYKAAIHFMNMADRTYREATENVVAPERHVRLKLTASF